MPQPSPMLRRSLRLEGNGPIGAHLRHEPWALRAVASMAQRVGDDVLTPGWTSYATRLQYQTYDVTSLLRRGDNVIGALLGSGWYRGQIGFRSIETITAIASRCSRNSTSSMPTARARRLGSDAQWKAADQSDSDWPRSTAARPTTRASRRRVGRARVRRRKLEGRARRRASEGHADCAGGPAGPSHRRGDAGQDPHLAVRPDHRRHGAEHGRLGAPHGRGSRRNDGHAPSCRSPRSEGQLLHRESPRRRPAGRLHAQRRRQGGVRAALHVSGVPLRPGRGLPGHARARQSQGHRGPFGNRARQRVLDVGRADQSAAAQHPLGPEGQLRGRPHRLPAARRASRLDRRCAGVLAHRGLQHGRRRLLHQVAEGRCRRSARVRRRAARRPGRADATEQTGGRVSRVGRRRGDHPVEHVSELRRQAGARDAVSEHDEMGRVHAASRRRRLSVDGGLHVRRLACLRDDALGLPRGDDRKGSDRDGVLRAFDGSARADAPRSSARRTITRGTRRCATRSRRPS